MSYDYDYDSEPNITFDDILADLNKSISTLFAATEIDDYIQLLHRKN